MKKAILFGAGPTGRRKYEILKKSYNIVAFFDNDKEKEGRHIEGIEIFLPSLKKTKELEVEFIIITSVSGALLIKNQLLEMGFNDEMIIELQDGPDTFTPFINHLAQMYKENGVEGAVAELGVYRGNTAKKINGAFDDRKLYLFDTFEGFAEEDVNKEKMEGLSEAKRGWFEDTSVELVLSKMPHPENAIIYKGYFPDTVKDGLDDTFCMVRLDMDLYEPTVAALDFFTPKMTKGGCIILHDYFGNHYKGIKKAVTEYMDKNKDLGLHLFPLSDISVAIIGF